MRRDGKRICRSPVPYLLSFWFYNNTNSNNDDDNYNNNNNNDNRDAMGLRDLLDTEGILKIYLFKFFKGRACLRNLPWR